MFSAQLIASMNFYWACRHVFIELRDFFFNTSTISLLAPFPYNFCQERIAIRAAYHNSPINGPLAYELAGLSENQNKPILPAWWCRRRLDRYCPATVGESGESQSEDEDGSKNMSLPRKEANVLKGHEGAVLAARFNNDGNYCLSCGKDRTIRLWNPHRGIHIKTYKAHGREVRDVHVTTDNSKLCSCGGDRQIFYWDVATGRVIRKFRGHDSEVNAVKFNEYASVVVSAGYDQSLRAWDCRSHSTEPIQIIDSFSDSVMSVLLTKTEIIGGSVDGTVRTFDIRIGREICDDLGQPVNCISMSNDGNCVLASGLDSKLRLLDRSTGEQLQEYKGHTCKSYKLDCCLTNTDAHVTGGSEDGFIYFWDLVDASVVSSFRAHTSVVTSVSYHPKDDCMITASVDGTIRVWKT